MHLPARIGFIATTGGYALGITAVLYGGWLSDKYGRRPINVWGNLIFLMMIYPTFTWITSAPRIRAHPRHDRTKRRLKLHVGIVLTLRWPRPCASRFVGADLALSTQFRSRSLVVPHS